MKWTAIDCCDLSPTTPGLFVSHLPAQEFEVNGRMVMGLTPYHAQICLFRSLMRSTDKQDQPCSECGHYIRYAVLLENELGEWRVVGKDCAQKLGLGLDAEAWKRWKVLDSIREVKTQRGTRFVLSIDVPAWYWDIPKAERPEWASVRKAPKRDSYGRKWEAWQLSIWGESAVEVLNRYGNLSKTDQLPNTPATNQAVQP